MPDTKPDLKLDDEGVCSACRSYENRKAVDWESRERELMVHKCGVVGPPQYLIPKWRR